MELYEWEESQEHRTDCIPRREREEEHQKSGRGDRRAKKNMEKQKEHREK
jgi:hypothetical protein